MTCSLTLETATWTFGYCTSVGGLFCIFLYKCPCDNVNLRYRGTWLSFYVNDTIMHPSDLLGSPANLKHNIKRNRPHGLFYVLHMICDLLACFSCDYHKVCQNIWTVPLTNGTRCTFTHSCSGFHILYILAQEAEWNWLSCLHWL